MFEKFRPNRKVEETTTEVQREVIVPMSGLEDMPFSIPEVDDNGIETGDHYDDWYVTSERAVQGKLKLNLSRYKHDGSIDSWHDVDHDQLMNHQAKVEAEGRVERSRQDLGVSAIRLMTVGMVNHIRNSDAFAERRAAEDSVSANARQAVYDRDTEGAARIEDYKAAKRRENPLVQMSRGKHHARI